MPFIFVTFEVLKLLRSMEVRADLIVVSSMLHVPQLSISSILVTFDVSKPLRSREVKEEQPQNIYRIFVTFEVSNLLRSREVKEEQ